MTGETKRKIFTIVASAIALFLIVFVLANGFGGDSFSLDKDALMEFFQGRINEIVPGDESVVATELRFASSDNNEGVYVVYEPAAGGEGKAFLMLIHPAGDRVDYEIIGAFQITDDGQLELIGGSDPFAGVEPDIYRYDREEGSWRHLE